MSAIWLSIWRGDIWESVWATPWGTAVAPGPGPGLPGTHEAFRVTDGGGTDFHVSDGAGGDEIFGVLK